MTGKILTSVCRKCGHPLYTPDETANTMLMATTLCDITNELIDKYKRWQKQTQVEL